MNERIEDINRFDEIKDEISELLWEANNIVSRQGSDVTKERWRGYVLSHIEMALSEEHDWLGRSMCTMNSILEEIRDEED